MMGASKPAAVVLEATLDFLQMCLVMGRAVVDTSVPFLLVLNLLESTVVLLTLRCVAVGRTVHRVPETVQAKTLGAEPVDYTWVETPLPEHLKGLIESLD